ncbi:DinB family protein [Herpetosiphon gulosus]|uniref:DinB-like domain-containing protein n=1 Tax=Herpetosiphon gulosus TaxID=1973496 RepID=A0ABP9X5Q7_9CHLR
MRNLILKLVSYFFFIRPAKQRSYGDYEKLLTESGTTIEQRANQAADLPENRQQLRHIVGIERWGAQRLKVCFGEPFSRDEYDVYAPAEDRSWPQLLADFKATRQETIALAKRFALEQPASDVVEHNDFGAWNARTWLQYLYSHGLNEAKRLR